MVFFLGENKSIDYLKDRLTVERKEGWRFTLIDQSDILYERILNDCLTLD